MGNCLLLPLDPPPQAARLEALRSLVEQIERSPGGVPGRSSGQYPGQHQGQFKPRVCALGAPALDAALPDGGLALGRLHEIVAPPDSGAAGMGLLMAMLKRLMTRPKDSQAKEDGKQGIVLWCGRGEGLSGLGPYGPGLSLFGLDPARLVLVRTGNDAEALWAMEEALRCPVLSAVVGETSGLDLVAARRLQLAAERHGVTALLLNRPRSQSGSGQRASGRDPSAATTRWQVFPAPAPNPGRVRWRVELLRCRGGRPRDFILDWNHATGDLAVVAAPGDGFATPAPQADAAD